MFSSKRDFCAIGSPVLEVGSQGMPRPLGRDLKERAEALTLAAITGYVDILCLCLEKEADVEARNLKGRTVGPGEMGRWAC